MKPSKGGGGGRGIGSANVDPRQVARDYTIVEDLELKLAARSGRRGSGEQGDGNAETACFPILRTFNRTAHNSVAILSMFCNTARAGYTGRNGRATPAGSSSWRSFFSRSAGNDSHTSGRGRGETGTFGGRGSGRSSGGSGGPGGGGCFGAGSFFSSRR